MTAIVSLNGPDNVGKTTQLRWLAAAAKNCVLGGAIDRWHPRWARLAAGDFARWWFVDSSTAEHVALVFDSHAARRAQAGDKLLLEDRGWPMLVAVCAATASVKEDLAPVDALRVVEALTTSREPCLRDGIHLLLRHSNDPTREAELALAREPTTTSPRYASYQHALSTVIDIQRQRGDYSAMVVRGDLPIADVQREIRQIVARYGVTVNELPAASLNRVWVLAGMSESGKSTVGALLRDEHAVTRLKIGYFLGIAADRAGGVDPYRAWNELEQAERLAEEVLRFAAASKSTTVSLESAHRFEATRHLRRVLGAVCQLAYVDVDQDVRAARAVESSTSLRERDETKTARGAERLASEADWVIDNTGSQATLKLAVARMVRTADRPHHLIPSSMGTLSPMLAGIVQELADDETAAVIATGSTNTSAWVDGWSDIDLLVVRDRYPPEWLRQTGELMSVPAPAKVGLTFVTTDEVAAGILVPRVVHSLRRVVHEPERVLFCREGFSFPVPSLDDDDRASRGELGLVVMTLRRLLTIPAVNVRAIHKHTLLIMKIVLRACGTDVERHDDVVDAFATMTSSGAALPDPRRLTSDVDGSATRETIAATQAVLDIVARMPAALGRKGTRT